MPNWKKYFGNLADCAGATPPPKWSLPPVGGDRFKYMFIIGIGLNAIVLNSFYSALSPQVRIVILPACIALWWFAYQKLKSKSS